MDLPEDFSARLRLALGRANLSPTALSAAVGIDKSVVSRWISGKVRPTRHNLTRIAVVLAERLPNFSSLSFTLPAPAFQALLEPSSEPSATGLSDHCLPIPFELLGAARKETARRGVEYFGTYSLYYWSFGQPGKYARMTLILRPENGLIEARYGAEGFSFRGWALLLLNRVYMVMSEERFEAMTFLVLNAGQQPKARFITGVLTGPAEGLLVPTSAAIVLVREGELTGDDAADLAAFAEACRSPAIIPEDKVPPAARAVLQRATRMQGTLLNVPFASGEIDGQ